MSISIVDKLKKKTPDEIRKIPTDENGNRLVEIDNEPVLIGTKEGLEKVGENLNNVFLKNIDNTITKLKSKAKFELNGTGIYNDVKGHHPLIGKAFEGVKEYDYKQAFSVSPKKLDEISGIVNIHPKITGQQNTLYTAWRKSNPNKTLEIDDMAEIEIKAMVNVGIPEDIATGWVVKALEDLKAKGVTTIKNIPWNGVNN